jgi:hypothetical protein
MLAEVEIEHKFVPRPGTYDAFRNMCAALCLPNKSLIAVLTVFLDESYNQPTIKKPNDPLLYTVGCWVSTALQWKRFAKQWRAALRNAEIEWFHMSEYESRLNQYEDWSDLKRVGVLKRLHRIIKEHTIYGVTISVNCAAYDEVVTGDLKRAFGKSYYGFDVRMIMKSVAEWADKNNQPGPIHYVFAELKGQGNELDKIFTECLKDAGVRKWLRLSGTWTKGLMRDVTQLQAADIVAYELNKRAVNHISQDTKIVRRSLNNLATGLYGNRLAPLYFGKSELIHLLYEARKGAARI